MECMPDQAVKSSNSDVVLDLSGMKYVEASFLKNVLHMARKLEGESRRLVIQDPEPEVARTLLLAGFLHLSDALDLRHPA